MTSSNALKIRIAVALLLAICLLVCGIVCGGIYVPLMLVPVGLILLALFTIPSDFGRFGYIIILGLYALLVLVGVASYPTRYVCGCPAGPDWNYIACLSITLTLCLIALVMLLIIENTVWRTARSAEGKPSSQRERGSTIWEIILIIGLLAAIPILAIVLPIVEPQFSRVGYPHIKQEIQQAVNESWQNSSGTSPIIPGANVSINGSEYPILDLCKLFNVSNKSTWREYIPYGVYSAPGPNNDNCDGNSSCCGCCITSHYIWAVDSNGSVLSTCVNTNGNGGGCANVSQDGFQNVWP